jgi:TniQ
MPVEMLLPARRPRPSVPQWPHRPRPLTDELLTSYISRLALGMDMKPITFLNAVFGSAKNLLAQDLDNFAPTRIVDRIAHGVGRDTRVIADCTLASYAGTLLIRHNPCPMRTVSTSTPGLRLLP